MRNAWRISLVLVGSLLVAGVTAEPKGYDYDYQFDGHDPYNSVVPVKEVYDYHAKPKYAFGYEVDDYYNQLSHGRWEIRDGDVTQGQYRVLLPDGRIQIVSYIADKGGYRPTIQYVGKGVHPPPPPAYANVKPPKYIEPEPEFFAATPTPLTPIVKAPFGLDGPIVEQGPLKLRVNPGGLVPLGPSAIPQVYDVPSGEYGIGGSGYGQGYGYGYSYGQGYGQGYGYDPVFAASSKVSKKRALLYDRTLFRKDVEKRAPLVKRSGKTRVVRRLVKKAD